MASIILKSVFGPDTKKVDKFHENPKNKKQKHIKKRLENWDKRIVIIMSVPI